MTDDPRTDPSDPNLSTEHQKPGDAKKPGDTLDRDQPPPEDDGGRKSKLF